METSRIPGFYNMDVADRRKILTEMELFTDEETEFLYSKEALEVATADNMIENVLGRYPLPIGLGPHMMEIAYRRKILTEMELFTDEETDFLYSKEALEVATADNMIENVIGTYPLPLGLGLYFIVNGKEYAVPIAIEEPSVVASASYIAKIVRSA